MEFEFQQNSTIENRIANCMSALIWLNKFTDDWAEWWDSVTLDFWKHVMNEFMESVLSEVYIHYDIYTALNTIQIIDNGESSWLYRKYYAVNIDIDSFYKEDKKICGILCDKIQQEVSLGLQEDFEDEIASLEK